MAGTFHPWPTGTTKYEKRNIATEIPAWEPNTCIQCAQCAMVCPHASIRVKVYDAGRLAGAPATFKSAEAKGKEFAGLDNALSRDIVHREKDVKDLGLNRNIQGGRRLVSQKNSRA